MTVMKSAIRGWIAVFPLFSIASVGCEAAPSAIADDVDVGGTYSLVERTEGGSTWWNPLATGSLVLDVRSSSPTAVRGHYRVDMLVPAGHVVDAGTFSLAGGEWTQRSDETGLETRGAIEVAGLELVLDLTSPRDRASRSVWFHGLIAGAR